MMKGQLEKLKANIVDNYTIFGDSNYVESYVFRITIGETRVKIADKANIAYNIYRDRLFEKINDIIQYVYVEEDNSIVTSIRSEYFIDKSKSKYEPVVSFNISTKGLSMNFYNKTSTRTDDGSTDVSKIHSKEAISLNKGNYEIVVIMPAVVGLPIVRIYNLYDQDSSIYNTTPNVNTIARINSLLNVNDTKAIYNNINIKRDIHKYTISLPEDYKNIGIVSVEDKIKSVLGEISDYEISFDEEGNVREFYNPVSKINYSYKGDFEESTEVIEAGNDGCIIYGQEISRRKNGFIKERTIYHNLTGKYGKKKESNNYEEYWTDREDVQELTPDDMKDCGLKTIIFEELFDDLLNPTGSISKKDFMNNCTIHYEMVEDIYVIKYSTSANYSVAIKAFPYKFVYIELAYDSIFSRYLYDIEEEKLTYESDIVTTVTGDGVAEQGTVRIEGDLSYYVYVYSNEGPCSFIYTDKATNLKVQYNTDGNIKSYNLDSLIYDIDPEYVYIKDIYGIPRKFKLN